MVLSESAHSGARWHSWKQSMLTHEFQALVIMGVINVGNVLLVVVKVYVALVTGSFSIANSALESFGDVFTGILFLIQRLQARCVKETRFPRGRSTTALSNVVAATVMLLLAGVNAIISLDRCYRGQYEPEFSSTDVCVVVGNIFLKFLLFGICLLRKDVPQIRVLMKDQITDVITNSVAMFFVSLSIYFHKYWDIIGAVIIAGVICMNWFPVLFSNCNKIHGVTAKPAIIEQLRKTIESHDSIKHLHDLVAYHRGEEVAVELYITPHDMGVDVSETLTKSLKTLDYVGIVHVFITLYEPRTPPTDQSKESCEEDKLL